MIWAVWDYSTKRALALASDREVALIQAGVERAGVACGKGDPKSNGDIDVRLWATGTGVRYPR